MSMTNIKQGLRELIEKGEKAVDSRDRFLIWADSANLAVPLAKVVLAAEKMRRLAQPMVRGGRQSDKNQTFIVSVEMSAWMLYEMREAGAEYDAAIEELKRTMEGK